MRRSKLQVRKLEDRLAPAIATWDGGAQNSFWMLPANWVGDVAPQPGDDLVFGTATQKNAFNDFSPGTVFRSITLNDTNYQLTGNAVTLTAGINGAFTSSTMIGLDLILAAPQTFSLSGGAGYNITGRINLNGQILTATINGGGGGPITPPFPGIVSFSFVVTGNGGIIKDGSQLLNLAGDNNFTGPIDHRSGVLNFFSSNAGGATGPANQTLVGPGAVLTVRGNIATPESITFADSAPNNQNQLIAGNPGIAAFTGPITVQGRSRWLGDIVIVGGLFGAGAISVQGNLNFPAGVPSSYSGTLSNETGRFVFDNIGLTGEVIAVAFPLSNMTVAGNGTIGPLRVEGGATLRPGDAGVVGTLTTGSLIQGGIYEVDLSAVGNDQVVVRGSVTLAQTLTVLPAAGFTPPPTAVYRIIDNDGFDPVVGAFAGLTQGTLVTTVNGVPLFINYRGGDGNDVELTTTQPPPIPGPRPYFAVGAGETGAPLVNVYNEAGELIRSFFAYEESFRGGVHIAVADVTGDGIRDVITAPGFGGGPLVRIWDGADGTLVNQYLAYDASFRGGVFVAAAKIDSDPVNDIITGAGQTGGPHVKVFIGSSANVLSQFLAYDPVFAGGVRVAGTDGFLVGGDAFVPGTVVTGAGPGGGPHVRTWNGLSAAPIASFFAYDLNFTGGVYVAAGRVPMLGGNPADGIIVSPGSGIPDVRIFDINGSLRTSFLAYDPIFTGGVTIALRQTSSNGTELITGPGPGGGPHIKRFSLPNLTLTGSFFAFDPAFTGGVFVG